MQTTIQRGSFGVLALASVFAGAAQAAIPAVNASFYISGASAARAIPPAIATELCRTTNVDRAVWVDNPASVNYRIDVCTLKNDNSVPQALRGLKVAFYSRAAGGSLFGVRPVAIPQAIRFINGAACPDDDGDPASIQTCNVLTGDADFAPPDGTNDGKVPDFGLSDEEPVFTCNVAAENGPAQCTAAELAALKTAKVTAAATYQLPWTIQVGETLASELGGNISGSALTAIFVGTYTSVAQVKSAMGIEPAEGDADEGLKVCRRTNTSGTQAGWAHVALGASFCGFQTSAGSFVNEASDDDNAGNGFPLNYDVVENSSSSNLENCVIAAADRGRSIGINSLENAPKPGATQMAIDGIDATQFNAATGLYKWYAESTLNSNSDVINNAATLPALVRTDLTARATNAQRSAFLTLFRSNVRNPAKIVSSGLNGINALPNFGSPADPYDPATPTAWVTKNGNNCKPSTPIFPAP